MNDTWFALLVGAGALSSALVGGVFLAFSGFVMAALDRLPAAAAVAAMQSINRTVLTPWFLVPFFGALAAGLAIAGATAFGAAGAAACEPLLLAGGLAYPLGTFLVTVVGNLPLNRRLDSVDPQGEAAAAAWADYLRAWTRWNHLRTAAALLAAGLLLAAL